MSLTKKQWDEMWKTVKRIEKLVQELPEIKRVQVLASVEEIKNLIQSVVGQKS